MTCPVKAKLKERPQLTVVTNVCAPVKSSKAQGVFKARQCNRLKAEVVTTAEASRLPSIHGQPCMLTNTTETIGPGQVHMPDDVVGNYGIGLDAYNFTRDQQSRAMPLKARGKVVCASC